MSSIPPASRAKYNPVVLANLIVAVIFGAGNVVVILVPLADGATIAVLGLVNSIGLLVAFLLTGQLAQSRTTPLDPDTGEPLNPHFRRVA